MRPAVGVSLELVLLVMLLTGISLVPRGPGSLLYFLLVQLAATYLVHCPSHYLVGRAVGIRFRRIKLGRTTLAKALPERFGRYARLLPILTLSIERGSMAGKPKSAVRAMFYSGTVASSASAVVLAAYSAASGLGLQSLLAWAIALGYTLFDVVFSPRSGDVMRARSLAVPD